MRHRSALPATRPGPRHPNSELLLEAHQPQHSQNKIPFQALARPSLLSSHPPPRQAFHTPASLGAETISDTRAHRGLGMSALLGSFAFCLVQ